MCGYIYDNHGFDLCTDELGIGEGALNFHFGIDVWPEGTNRGHVNLHGVNPWLS